MHVINVTLNKRSNYIWNYLYLKLFNILLHELNGWVVKILLFRIELVGVCMIHDFGLFHKVIITLNDITFILLLMIAYFYL